MPSLAIHLAIAKRYEELNPNKISNSKDFQKGGIAPDFSEDFLRILTRQEKTISHYSDQLDKYEINFNSFRHDKKVNLKNDYWKGYYAHLLADHLFYSVYFKQEYNRAINDGTNLYEDFTMLISKIINDYNLKTGADFITDAVKQYLIPKTGDCQYLDYAKIRDFIENVSINLSKEL